MKATPITPEDFTRIAHDSNGNPRYVCHFLKLLNEGDDAKGETRGLESVSLRYRLALNKAAEIGGRKFHNKQYGGGIVFQSYNIQDTCNSINEIREVNTDFKKEWGKKEFRKMERAILNHLRVYQYKVIVSDGSGTTPAPRTLTIHETIGFNTLSELLGLAYTSSSAYAAYWICNAVNLQATENHDFTGFAINAKGECVGIAADADENEIYITLND